MRETCKTSGVSRRTVLLAATGAAPLLALTGGQAHKDCAAAVKYQATRRTGSSVTSCNSSCPQRLQDGGRRHRAQPAGALCGSRRPDLTTLGLFRKQLPELAQPRLVSPPTLHGTAMIGLPRLPNACGGDPAGVPMGAIHASFLSGAAGLRRAAETAARGRRISAYESTSTNLSGRANRCASDPWAAHTAR